jgi:hypothetical protein
MRYFLIAAVLVLAVLFLTSCTTAEVPQRVANTYAVTGKVYCGTPIGHNIEEIIVGWLNATVAPAWEPVCANYED